MRRIQPLFLLLLLVSFGCSKDKAIGNPDVLGEWELIEEKEWTGTMEPEVFQPVESDKTITFLSDGTFQSNGDMCFMSRESNTLSSGMFYPTLNSIEPAECQFAAPSSGIKYEIDGKHLIIKYPCIEICEQKYERK